MSASDVGEMHLETSATNKFYMESMVPNPKAYEFTFHTSAILHVDLASESETLKATWTRIY